LPLVIPPPPLISLILPTISKKPPKPHCSKQTPPSQQALSVLDFRAVFFAVIKLLEGFTPIYAYEKQYLRWRSNPKIQDRFKHRLMLYGDVLIICILPLTLLRYTVTKADDLCHP
jgi:hypothetical protein